MDIRSFFVKKPLNKKRSATSNDISEPNDGDVKVADSIQDSSKLRKQKSENDSHNSKIRKILINKRHKTIDDDDDEVIEVPPKFFLSNNPPSKIDSNRTIAVCKRKTGDYYDKNYDEGKVNDRRDHDRNDGSGGKGDSSQKKQLSSSSKNPPQEEPTLKKKPLQPARKAVGVQSSKNKRRIRDEGDDDDTDEQDNGEDDSYLFVDDSDDSFNEVEKIEQPAKSKRKGKPKSTAQTPSPQRSKAKLGRKSLSSSSSTVTYKKKKTKPILLEPTTQRDSFEVDRDMQVPEFMAGLTFVFTGIMDDLNRDDATDLVKTLGARVTGQVSGKTSYLVCGPVLEDGRDYKEGSKYRKAVGYGEDKTKIVVGEKYLYGLCHAYHDKALKEKGIVHIEVTPKNENDPEKTTISSSVPATQIISVPIRSCVVSNPYAKKYVVNPHAKNSVSNPYGKSKSCQKKKISFSSHDVTSDTGTPEVADERLSLWVDRYKPTHTRDILGNQAKVKQLQSWLRTWEKTFNNSKNSNKVFSNPRGPWKAALLSGPPGIGKTTTATLVAKEDGRDVLEFNASDVRSKKALTSALGDLTGSQGISFENAKKSSKQKGKSFVQKRCIIMDEVDGMGAGDRSGTSELIQMIKKSMTPIICICNDRQSQKLKCLVPYCMDLRYSRPNKSTLANRALRIAEQEGMLVERNAAEAISESCGNDVRQVINLLQMWSQKDDNGHNDDANGGRGSTALTYQKLKERGRSIQKDEMLHVTLFDAAKLILEGPIDLAQADNATKLSSLMKRSDAFFVDYSFTGLIVQQNYTKVVQGQYLRLKHAGDAVKEHLLLERLHKAAESMSDYNLTESQIRGGDMNWSLLSTIAMLAVKTGYHAGDENGGFLGKYPEFSSWMGKNATMGKNYRSLNELKYHMNYKVSANSQELRHSYIPVLRDRIFSLLKKGSAESTKVAIELMDEYGLSRNDVGEKLNILSLDKKAVSFDDLDSKQKAAFTREYNAGSHTSAALVRDQGGERAIKRKRKKSAFEDDENDMPDSSDEEVDHKKEMENLAAQFQRKGRKKKTMKKNN